MKENKTIELDATGESLVIISGSTRIEVSSDGKAISLEGDGSILVNGRNVAYEDRNFDLRVLKLGQVMDDGTIYIGSDGATPLFTTASNEVEECKFSHQFDLVAQKNGECAHGHSDWRVPTPGEAVLLSKNWKDAGLLPEFNTMSERSGIWTSEHIGRYGARTQKIGGDLESSSEYALGMSLRLVRSGLK